jgi:hypothetical protein
MATRAKRDMTVEEFDAWAAAQRNVSDAKDACAEEGGPRISLVPLPTSVPVDFLPDEVSLPVSVGPTPTPGGLHAVPFTPEPSRKAGGWSAARQRMFIESLAETGSVHLAAKSAGLSARSAYALRIRSGAFAAAWDAAQQLAVGRLSALAFDRAIHGRIEQVYRDGELIGEKQLPSDKLLTWLLARLDPKRFAAPWERRKDDTSDPQAEAQQAFPTLLDHLTDLAAD